MGVKMSVLTLGTGRSNTPGKSIKDIFAEVFCDNEHPELNIPGISSLPKDRRNKVVMVRRQLAHGTYNIDERLDNVIDQVFIDLTP
jgi:hypothetical protein